MERLVFLSDARRLNPPIPVPERHFPAPAYSLLDYTITAQNGRWPAKRYIPFVQSRS